MKYDITIKGPINKFPGLGGWCYIAVPKKYTKMLQQKRKVWGRYPIIASVGNSVWEIKLMMKKGGDFFVALKTDIRNKENIDVGDKVVVSFKFS